MPDRPTHPNIVIILTDDLGYGDLSCQGRPLLRTPHLDRLAAGGIKLTSFYVAWPARTPARGALLTGRYPQRNGVYDMIRNEAPDFGYRYQPGEYEATFERIGGMDTREVLLPRIVGSAGYSSGIFGKWDLGVHRRFLPLSRGFDVFYGFVNTGIDYYTHERYGVPSMYRDNSPTTADKGTYCTDLFEREAVRFLEANHRRPFFLYVPFNSPHGASNLDPAIRGGAQAPARCKAMYPGLQAQAGTEQRTRYGKMHTVPNRAARRLEFVGSVTAMDAAIGRLLGLLDGFGIAANTIVIFFSDNGGLSTLGRPGPGCNLPLRAGKGWLYEGGVREPTIIRAPDVTQPNSVSHKPMVSMDFFPTMLDLAGLPLQPKLHVDGQSLLPHLKGDDSGQRTFYWHYPHYHGSTWKPGASIRDGDWKLIEFYHYKNFELYNLADDPVERQNVAKAKPTTATLLRVKLLAWQKQMQAKMPVPNPDYDPNAKPDKRKPKKNQ